MPFPCEYCGELCKKREVRVFCSLKCKLLGKIKIVDGCWLWQGKTNIDGYGLLMINSKRYTSHRVSYELFAEPIESSKYLLHRCLNTSCINPQHLFPGTSRDIQINNVNRGILSAVLKNIQPQLIKKYREDLTKKIIKIKEIDYGIKSGTTSQSNTVCHPTPNPW